MSATHAKTILANAQNHYAKNQCRKSRIAINIKMWISKCLAVSEVYPKVEPTGEVDIQKIVVVKQTEGAPPIQEDHVITEGGPEGSVEIFRHVQAGRSLI